MSLRVDFTSNSEQIAEIDQAINTSPHPEVRQGAIAICLLHLGHKPEVVIGAAVQVISRALGIKRGE